MRFDIRDARRRFVVGAKRLIALGAERAVQGLLLLLVLGPPVALLIECEVAADGPRYCVSAFRSGNPDIAGSFGVAKRIWTRTQGARWVAAIVIQPHDLSQGPSTVVCRFESTNYVNPTVEVFDGDESARFKDASVSNLNPSMWFR